MAAMTAAADAEKLYKAMTGAGTNEAALISVFGYRSREQLVQISEAFRAAYAKDLAKVIESETSGHFRVLLLQLLKTREELICDIIHRSVHGPGTKDLWLIDIFATLPGFELAKIKDVYQAKFKASLKDDVSGDTSGDYRAALLTLLEGTRPSPGTIDPTKARGDAEALYFAGERRIGTDEAEFIRIVAHNSAEHLQLVSQEYKAHHGKTIEAALKSELSFHFKELLTALCTPLPLHFARRVHDATAGVGTRDDLLCNIFSFNPKHVLKTIAAAFQATYGKSMSTIVGDETSGDYRKLLLALLD